MAMIFMGIQRFLYKVSAEKNCNTAWTTFSFMGTVTVLSSLLFLFIGDTVPSVPYLLLISLVNSAAFLTATIAHMEALKCMPATIVFPIIRLNAVFVVVFSILYFKDELSMYQIMGIVLALVVLGTLTRSLHTEEGTYQNPRRGILLISLSVFAGSIAAISSKFAAIHTSKLGFIALSYLFSTLFSFCLRNRLHENGGSRNTRGALTIGLIMGLVNLAGYYCFLKALTSGPLSIIASITGMHFTIAITLSFWIYQEKMSASRIAGISLAVLSMILLRL